MTVCIPTHNTLYETVMRDIKVCVCVCVKYVLNKLWINIFFSSSRITTFPNTLSKDDTRKAISIAFTKWSDVSPLTFTEITDPNKSADIIIGELMR